MNIAIRPLTPADAVACDGIVLSLPEFFGHAGGRADCAQAVRTQPGRVAADGARVIGFATWQQRTPATAEVTWMAVHRDRRHQGVGSALLERLVEDLRARGFALALVMTSADPKQPQDAPYPRVYEQTRRFWMSRGFLPLVELDIWDTDIALLLVRPLNASGRHEP